MKTKYRIIHRWTTKENLLTGENRIQDEYYEIQQKNILTILFSWKGIWDKVPGLPVYMFYDEAQDALIKYMNEKYIKEEEHSEVISVMET